MKKKLQVLFIIFIFSITINTNAYFYLNQKVKNDIEKLTNKYLIKYGEQAKNESLKLDKYIYLLNKSNLLKNKLRRNLEKNYEKKIEILKYSDSLIKKQISFFDFNFSEIQKRKLKNLGIKLKKINLDETKLKVVDSNWDYLNYTNPKLKAKNVGYYKNIKVYALKYKNNNLLVLEIKLKNKKIISEKVLRILPKNGYKIINFYQRKPSYCYSLFSQYKGTELEGLDETYAFAATNLRDLAHNMEDWVSWKYAFNSSGNLCSNNNYWKIIETANGLDLIIINMNKDL